MFKHIQIIIKILFFPYKNSAQRRDFDRCNNKVLTLCTVTSHCCNRIIVVKNIYSFKTKRLK